MKVNYLLTFLFLAFVTIIVIANVDGTDLINCTELNGQGCVCHNLDRDTTVHVWVEGPESLYVGQTGLYKMFMSGGPAEAGGYNVAGRFGEMALVDTLSFQHPMILNELTQAFPLPFPTPQDTIYWDFGYKVQDTSITWDTIYSCGLSIVWDTIPDFHDHWNFGPKFPVKILSEPVTGVDERTNSPNDFKLYQNYPNPFNPSTKIQFAVTKSSKVLLRVYDVTGHEVSTLVNETKSSGEYEISFNAADLPSGIYFYNLSAGNFTETKKMLLLK